MHKHNVIIILATLFLNNVQANNLHNSNTKITAIVTPGCIVNISNYNFGNVTAKDLINSTNYDDKKIAIKNNLEINCSKNTVITISQQGKINSSRSGYSSNLLSLNNSGVFKINEVVNYKFLTNEILGNENYNVIYRPNSERLGTNNADGNFTLSLKTLTENVFSIPLTASLLNSYGYSQVTGNYSDTSTFTLQF